MSNELPQGDPTSPLRRPRPPLAKRLNRNALTVAAALAGITVLTVLVATRPTGAPAATSSVATAEASPPLPARPTFLDLPPKLPPPDSGTTRAAGGGRLAADRSATGVPSDAMARGAALVSARGVSGEFDGSGMPVSAPTPPLAEPAGSAGPPTTPASSARDAAYQAALTSSPLVGDGARHEARETGNATFAVTPAMKTVDSAAVPTSHPSAPSTSSRVELEDAGSPYTVRAGTVIPGLLLTGVNSDLPGEVVGQISRNVYDSRTQETLLIPVGTRVIGMYDTRSVTTGRLVVSWTRLILPDGRSMTLPRLAATDESGETGLHDQVDHHYGRVYGAALLTSLITAGIQLSQPQQATLYAPPSSRQVAAGALGQTMGDVALEGARRNLAIPPTVVIRPGQPFNVFLAGDLAFPAPYEVATR